MVPLSKNLLWWPYVRHIVYLLIHEKWPIGIKGGGLYGISLMKCIPPPGFRICLVDICQAQLNWKYSAISYNKLYI